MKVYYKDENCIKNLIRGHRRIKEKAIKTKWTMENIYLDNVSANCSNTGPFNLFSNPPFERRASFPSITGTTAKTSKCIS